MKNETTPNLINRLKRISIEKWNLDIEATQILQELWERVPSLSEEEKPKTLVKKESDK
jgi:hypothetical protein